MKDISRYENPTRPAYLKGERNLRGRSYSPSEVRFHGMISNSSEGNRKDKPVARFVRAGSLSPLSRRTGSWIAATMQGWKKLMLCLVIVTLSHYSSLLLEYYLNDFKLYYSWILLFISILFDQHVFCICRSGENYS